MGDYFIGYACGMITGIGIMSAILSTSNTIPRNLDVEKGYVIPGFLEIKVEDLDKRGEKQTIAKYQGTNYLFKEDKKGIPYMTPYQIKVEAEK